MDNDAVEKLITVDERTGCVLFLAGGAGNCRLPNRRPDSTHYLPMCRIAEGEDPTGCPHFLGRPEETKDE